MSTRCFGRLLTFLVAQPLYVYVDMLRWADVRVASGGSYVVILKAFMRRHVRAKLLLQEHLCDFSFRSVSD